MIKQAASRSKSQPHKLKQTRSARDDAEQSRLFIEKAREIGADEEKSQADDLISQLAKKPPSPRKIPSSDN
jgi:hypothetical protein